MVQPHDPRRFLDLAHQLGNGTTDETKLRTAVGRAYYALFLLARKKTAISPTVNVHQAVIAELKKTSGMTATADQLSRLRRLRTVADYELVPSNPLHDDWVKNWNDCKLISQNILPRLL